MSDYSQIINSSEFIHFIQPSLVSKYKYISINSEIQSGLPCIKGTRIVVFEVFIAQMQGYSIDKLILDYKEMKTPVTREKLLEAFEFSAEVVSRFIHEKRASAKSK